jgi:hypothetical protein
MDSGAMIYIPSLLKIGSANHKLIRRDSHTDTQTDGKDL